MPGPTRIPSPTAATLSPTEAAASYPKQAVNRGKGRRVEEDDLERIGTVDVNTADYILWVRRSPPTTISSFHRGGIV